MVGSLEEASVLSLFRDSVFLSWSVLSWLVGCCLGVYQTICCGLIMLERDFSDGGAIGGFRDSLDGLPYSLESIV